MNKGEGGRAVGRFRGSPMKPRRGAQEEIDRIQKKREREREDEEIEGGGEVYDISKGHFFFSPSFHHFHKRVKNGRTAGRVGPRKSGKDKKVKQKADYVTPGMKYGVGKGGVSGQTQ